MKKAHASCLHGLFCGWISQSKLEYEQATGFLFCDIFFSKAWKIHFFFDLVLLKLYH